MYSGVDSVDWGEWWVIIINGSVMGYIEVDKVYMRYRRRIIFIVLHSWMIDGSLIAG